MIIFLYGEETFLSQEKLNSLKAKFLKEVDASATNYLLLDGAKVSRRQIYDSLSQGVLLAKKRLVVIKNLSDNPSQSLFRQLPDLLANYQDLKDANIIVIFEAKSEKDLAAKFKKPLLDFLKKQPYTQHNKRLTSPQLNVWIQNFLRARQAAINRQALEQLKLYLNNDLWQISAELKKILHFKQGQLKESNSLKGRQKIIIIQKEDVDQMVSASAEANIFALTDAISVKDKAKAFKLLEDHLAAGVNEQYLLAMVIRQFRILLQIKESVAAGLTSSQIISQFKLHPFVVQKGIMQSRRFTAPALKAALKELIKIDYQFKQGLTKLNLALDWLFLKF